MVVIMKREFTPEQLEAAVHTMEEGGVKVMVSKGAETTILGAEGNAEHIDQEKLSRPVPVTVSRSRKPSNFPSSSKVPACRRGNPGAIRTFR